MDIRCDSPFDTLEASFRVLGSGPGALCLDGRLVGYGLPGRPVALCELRTRLLHPSFPYDSRDGVLNALVARSQHRGGAWTVALAGMLLPGLRRSAGPMLRANPQRRHDLEAELLAGLVEAAADAPLSGDRVAASLVWAGVRRAHRLLSTEAAYAAHTTPTPSSAPPPPPWGHPDFVLDRAVQEEVVSHDQAEVIGATRLGGLSLHEFAAQTGTPYDTVRQRRLRGEHRLVAWILGISREAVSPNGPRTRVYGCGSTPDGGESGGHRLRSGHDQRR